MPTFPWFASLRRPSHSACQQGAGIAEFVIVAIPVLFVALGTIEIARWFLVRQAVGMALIEAARAGATEHAHPDAITAAFEQALLPLFPANSRGDAAQHRDAAMAERAARMADAPWQIEIISPSQASFEDFGDTSLPRRPAQSDWSGLSLPTGVSAINNDYQREQYERHLEKGWPQGRGPISGQTIFEANTLTLRLRYLHEPIVPGIRVVLQGLGDPAGNYTQRGYAQGYLPLLLQASLLMHSHPGAWPSKVLTPRSPIVTPNVPWTTPPADTWSSDASPCSGDCGESPSPLPGISLPPGVETLMPQADDPACGITICCTGV